MEIALLFLAIAVLFIVKTVKVVPQQNAWVVERLGKYHASLTPGLNFVVPFIDNVIQKHSLKEIPLDVPSQICITRDNTQLQVDGILYFQVTDPRLASYGSSNYIMAVTQLAQTSLRSVIGKLELDKTFEERDIINAQVVAAIDEAALNWGVKVLRYEIKDLTPPKEILHAMQSQITAEREKRALIAASEGRRQEQINIATGEREAFIARSEGEKQAAINKAQGEAASITAVADATAQAIERIAAAIRQPGGEQAVQLKVAEQAVQALAGVNGTSVHVFRLPNVFGKWCKPNYNSAVATFCHNITRDLPVEINDPNANVTLIYVDDVLDRFIDLMDGADAIPDADGFETVAPQYTVTVGELVRQITAFRECRGSLVVDHVGKGFMRALYATYVSYLPVERFAYEVPQYGDARGVFVEMLKTPDCGQFSYFTAHPGITRGGHYHHTKTEKFLVIKGQARFRFRHMQTGQVHELETRGEKPEIVETVPGWTHDITNIGQDEMVVMLWANEIFDRARPDTYACPV